MKATLIRSLLATALAQASRIGRLPIRPHLPRVRDTAGCRHSAVAKGSALRQFAALGSIAAAVWVYQPIAADWAFPNGWIPPVHPENGCRNTHWGCDQNGNPYHPDKENSYFDIDMSVGDPVRFGLTGNRNLVVWNWETGEWDPAPFRFEVDWCVWNFYVFELNICDGTVTINPPGPGEFTNEPETDPDS